MTTSNKPATADILRRAWEIRPSLLGLLGFSIVVLAISSVVDASIGPVLAVLAVIAASTTALTVYVAARTLRAEPDEEASDGDR